MNRHDTEFALLKNFKGSSRFMNAKKRKILHQMADLRTVSVCRYC